MKPPRSQSHDHVAKLRDGRISQNAFDVVLDQSDGGRHQRSNDADPGDNHRRIVRDPKEYERTRDEIDTGDNHRGGMDQCRDRCRALHGVGEPDMERHLRRFADRAGKQAKGGDREIPASEHATFDRAIDILESKGADGGVEHQQADQETQVTQTSGDERFLAGVDWRTVSRTRSR